MDIGAWEGMADWYDSRQGDEGDPWHRTLIDPTFLQVVGDLDDQDVLDLGCGNGYIGRKLARQGAHVTGVDASAPIIEHARRREAKEPLGIEYHLADAARLDMFEDAAFDAVIANMSLMDIEDGEAAIHEVGRLLRPMGRFVASLSHPCFDAGPASAWVVEKVGITTTVWRKVSRYRGPHQDPVPWWIEGQLYETVNYHRPLNWYFGVLRAAGFVVTRFEEPAPTEEFLELESLQGPWIAEIPLHCVIEAWKWDQGAR